MLNDAEEITAEQAMFLKDKLWQCEEDIFENLYDNEETEE
jgi:hypothetical protein